MMISSLGIGTFLTFLSACIYAIIGVRLYRIKKQNPNDRLAWLGFVIWWLGLAASTGLTLVTTLLVTLNYTSLPVHVGISLANTLVICAALWGLLFYLIYIYSGKIKLAYPLLVFFSLFFLTLLFWTLDRNPIRVELTPWAANIIYAQPASGPFFLFILVALIIPPVVVSVGVFLLVFRVQNRSAKYRLAILSFSIFVWFGVSFLASLLGFATISWWPLASRLIGLGAASLILGAYFPPKLIQTNFAIEAVTHEVQ